MKLYTKKDSSLDDDYLTLQYRQITPAINQILEICRQGTQLLLVEQNDRKLNIEISDIYYIEWVDDRSCICTEKEIYTTPQTLSQLENLLDSNIFFRVSKPILLNVYMIKWISSGLNMRLLAELINGERITISRHYRSALLTAIENLGKESKK